MDRKYQQVAKNVFSKKCITLDKSEKEGSFIVHESNNLKDGHSIFLYALLGSITFQHPLLCGIESNIVVIGSFDI